MESTGKGCDNGGLISYGRLIVDFQTVAERKGMTLAHYVRGYARMLRAWSLNHGFPVRDDVERLSKEFLV